jgi:hypothetical protein
MYNVGASNGTTSILNLVAVGQIVEKLKWRIHKNSTSSPLLKGGNQDATAYHLSS